MSRSLQVLLPLLAVMGCGELLSRDASPTAEAPAAEAPAERAEGGTHGSEPARFSVPFAWETSPEEPLAKARSFFAEALRANDQLAAQGAKHGRRSATPAERPPTPRATVIACSDAEVQSEAWDASPENDVFTVRNLGNQLSGALGSVEYGVTRLRTPVLLVIGHTGCASLQALGEEPETLSPQGAELAHATQGDAPKAPGGAASQEAVLANIHGQVAAAVKHFAALVHSGDVTVVGALYDPHDELGGGRRRLHVVNVNANTDAARVDAFVRAVRAHDQGASSTRGAKAAHVEERIRAIIERTERALPTASRRSP